MVKDEVVDEKTLFQIIWHGGNARAKAFEAMEACINDDFEKADKLLEESHEEMVKAHRIQARVIQEEAGGAGIKTTVILVHALDILMIATSEYDLIKRLNDLYKRKNVKA